MDDAGIPINYVDFTKEELAERAVWDQQREQKERALIEDARRVAYQQKADPLFFKWQAGISTKQEWLDARAAVEEEYPYDTGV